VREADVFSQGYRPGALGNRGLSPEELIKLRPGFVHVSLCALSHQGPWASSRGFHYIARMSCEVRGIETLNERGRGLSFASELWRYVTTGTGMLTYNASRCSIRRKRARYSTASTGRLSPDRAIAP
jgi:CoA-transferase family III